MRTEFWDYYPPDEETLSTISETGLVVLDANALLHAYRLSPTASDAWLTFLEEVSDRIWVPHQAALEYQRNRYSLVASQRSLASEIERIANRVASIARDDLTKQRSNIKRSRVFNIVEVDSAVEALSKPLQDLVVRARQDCFDLDVASRSEDTIHVRLTNVLAGAVGPAPDDAWYEAATKEGKRRYEAECPPGFRDAGKGDLRKYGDWFLWRQTLEHAEASPVPVALVSEERKVDWIRTESGRNFGPLPALRREFQDRVGEPFWMYSVAKILEQSASFGVPVDGAALHEANQLEQESVRSESEADARSVRLSEILRAVERFSDPTIVQDVDLRAEVNQMLADLLSSELKANAERLRGPGSADAPFAVS